MAAPQIDRSAWSWALYEAARNPYVLLCTIYVMAPYIATTVIGDPVGDFDMEDLIEDEPCIVTITASGYIKRMPVGTFRVQRRGGKGVAGGQLKDESDEVAKVFSATNHQYLLVFTSLDTHRAIPIPADVRQAIKSRHPHFTQEN